MVKYTVQGTTIRCIITTKCRFHYVKTYIGIARLNPQDSYNEEVGKQIAYKRALLQVKKEDIKLYENYIKTFQREHDNYHKQLSTYHKIKAQIEDITSELKELC